MAQETAPTLAELPWLASPQEVSKNAGVLAVTSRRLVYAHAMTGFPVRTVMDFPLEQITSVAQNNDVALAGITISVAGRITEFMNMNPKECTRFVATLRNAMTTTPTDQAQPSTADQLLKLKQLLDAGILTQQEYETKASVLKKSL